jgi:hypothetical protein
MDDRHSVTSEAARTISVHRVLATAVPCEEPIAPSKGARMASTQHAVTMVQAEKRSRD